MGTYSHYQRCSPETLRDFQRSPATFIERTDSGAPGHLELLGDAFRLLVLLSPSELSGAGLGSVPATTALGRALLGSRPLYVADESEGYFEGVWFDYGTPFYLTPDEVSEAVAVLRDISLEEAVTAAYKNPRPSWASLAPTEAALYEVPESAGQPRSQFDRLAESLGSLRHFYESSSGEFVVTWAFHS